MARKMKKRMPVLFIGHGTPMNAIEDNPYSREWQRIAVELPKPEAILCISAHWETWGSFVTAIEKPSTIHDFGGFPPELYQAQYSAPGDPQLAQELQVLLRNANLGLDQNRGLDHGCWSVLKQMYPKAEIPVVQLSLDASKPGPYHFEMAKGLAPSREQGVMVVGSGNMVHNLGRVVFRGSNFGDFNEPYGLDWALEANALFKKMIDENRFSELADYLALGRPVQLAVPTPEHYLPMLYALALKREDETLTYFNDVPLGGSLTMTSFVIQ
jgi:4,5-DOPA dioxygenase extradiol